MTRILAIIALAAALAITTLTATAYAQVAVRTPHFGIVIGGPVVVPPPPPPVVVAPPRYIPPPVVVAPPPHVVVRPAPRVVHPRPYVAAPGPWVGPRVGGVIGGPYYRGPTRNEIRARQIDQANRINAGLINTQLRIQAQQLQQAQQRAR